MPSDSLLSPAYLRQVQLLIQLMPLVFRESCFALKGGTAINLFVRDMPRLSVDLDLVYLPHEERATALSRIKEALGRIASDLRRGVTDLVVHEMYDEKTDALRLIAERKGTRVKIELSPVLRGTVYEPASMMIRPAAEERFGFVEIPVVSLADLFGGKICAALDRQHPRDLFDVKLLLETEGLNDQIRKAVLVYVLSHPRPISELLAPRFKEIGDVYRNEFSGMTTEPVVLQDLLDARARIVKLLHGGITGNEKEFLMSFKRCHPNRDFSDLPGIVQLPALKWKLINLKKMDPRKHRAALEQLSRTLQEMEGAS